MDKLGQKHCSLFVLWKPAVMLGRPGDLSGRTSLGRVSLPYKSDHEWERGRCRHYVQRRGHLSRRVLIVVLRRRLDPANSYTL